MVKTKKEKKPLTKGKKIVKRIFQAIGLIFLIALALFIIFFGKKFYGFAYKSLDTGYKTVDVKLTTEQKLKDFEYMYRLVCLDNPRKELFEESYGVSYDDVYKKYRNLVENSQSEFEFFAYMSSFLADLPGSHNNMTLPNYPGFCADASFGLSYIYGTQEMKDYTYSWTEVFREDVKKYSQIKPIVFYYVDGKYITHEASGSPMVNETYAGGQIISLNGKDPKDMCFEFFERFTPTYDKEHNCYFRKILMLNDTMGTKYTAEILMPDGKIITADLYDDPRVDIAFFDGMSTYRDLFLPAKKTSETKETETIETTTDVSAPASYRIVKDASRKLVYLDLLSCLKEEGDRLAEDLQKALDEVNAESVILDIRENGGGNAQLAYEYLLPVLFSHDVEFTPRIVGKLNEHNRKFDNAFYRLTGVFHNMEKKDGYYYYNDFFSVKGEAKRNYKIYVLTSQTTFSTADIITALCKEYDNAVVIGTNTGGEGIGGVALNCILPESHFAFVYVGTVNEKFPEDGIKGIDPDIYCGRTLDEYYRSKELDKQGIDSGSYEVRQTWDGALIKALKMIDNKE